MLDQYEQAEADGDTKLMDSLQEQIALLDAAILSYSEEIDEMKALMKQLNAKRDLEGAQTEGDGEEDVDDGIVREEGEPEDFLVTTALIR